MKNLSLISLSSRYALSGPTTFTSYSLSLSKSYFSHFSSSFLIKSKDFVTSSTSFSRFLNTPCVLHGYETIFFRNEEIINQKQVFSAEFHNCKFSDCSSRCIVAQSRSSNITVNECSFKNCKYSDDNSGNGGIIEFKGLIIKMMKSTVTDCFAPGVGSALYIDSSHKAKLMQDSFTRCYDVRNKVRDCTVFFNCQSGKTRDINNSLTDTLETAGFYIHTDKKSKCYYYTAYNLTGTTILSISIHFPIKYGNIINCAAESGLITTVKRDGFVTEYYFSGNDGFLVSLVPNVLVVFTDCVFKDYHERPKAGNIALRGKFLLADSTHGMYIDKGKTKTIIFDKKASNKPTYYAIFFVVVFIGSLAAYFYITKPISFTEEEEETNEENKENIRNERMPQQPQRDVRKQQQTNVTPPHSPQRQQPQPQQQLHAVRGTGIYRRETGTAKKK